MTETMYLCIAFLMMGGVYAALGSVLLQAGTARRLRVPLHVLGIALILWMFGLALASAAAQPGTGRLGLRLALAGRLAADGALLVLLAQLLGRHALVKKPAFWAAVCLPATALFALVLVGSAAESAAVVMKRLSFGWVEQAKSGSAYISWYHALFLVQAVLLAAMLFWMIWRRRTAEGERFVPAVSAALVAVVLRTAAQWHMDDSLTARLLAALLPLLPMMLAAAFWNQLERAPRKEAHPSPKLLTDAFRTHVYELLGAVAVVFAVIDLISSRAAGDGGEALGRSASLFAVAACLLLLNRLRINSTWRDLALSVCISYVVPMMTFGSRHSGNITAWSFLFVLLLVSLLFDHVMVLVVTLAATCMTQLALLAYQPVAEIQVDILAYLVRFSVLAVLAVLAYGIHYVYLRRLKENVNNGKKQRLVGDLSRSFIMVGEENFDRKVYGALEQCGNFMHADRAFLVLFQPKRRGIEYTCEWLANARITPGVREFAEAMLLSPPAGQPAERAHAIVYRNLARMRRNDSAARKMLRENGIRFLAGLAIRSGGEEIGYLGFTANTAFRKWSTEDNGFMAVIASMLSDAALKVEAERRINFIAYHDQLTSLPNRLLFNDRIAQAIALCGRSEKLLAVVFVDLDAFKSINDTLGHEMGDRLLARAAQVLRENVRGYDTVARFGGDEFTILLNQISNMEDLSHIMNKLMDALKCPFELGEQEIFITASAGVAVYPQDGADAAALIKSADTAMYHAKELGKNRFAFCSRGMKEEILENMRLSNQLYRALEKGQMSLLYQPLVSTDGHAVVGCEALPVWNLPERGQLSREVFQPLAEQTGLVVEIGAWVLENACAQNRRWQDAGFHGLRMVVSLSVQQLMNPRFIAQVGDILTRTGLAPKNLELEISESVANENTDEIVDAMNRLKELGVSLSINEFGAEYSSLSRLKLLPIDRIKMDTQFVHGLEHDEKDQTIATVIIGLAKSLNLRVVAEGVDSAPQIDFLRSKMCDELQGNYCYGAMTAEELENVLRKTHSKSEPAKH